MSRIKLTDNFYLDEFIHPEIYKQFGSQSTKYISTKLVDLVQFIREDYGEAIFINTWFTGGGLKNSGLRDYKNPLGGKLNRSRHYYGLCGDLHTKDIKRLQEYVYNNRYMLREKYGLTVIEDFKFTKTWCHISVEWTTLDYVQIIKP